LKNFEISGLANEFVVEIQETVNLWAKQLRFSKKCFIYPKNISIELAVMDARHLYFE